MSRRSRAARTSSDLFVTDVDGKIRTASWEPSFTDGWRGWREINGGRAGAGAPLHAVSRSKDKLDIFVVADQVVFTAAWEPAFTDGWHGWSNIKDGKAPGGRMTAVSRSKDKLDVFVAGEDRRVWTAAWEPAFTDGWRGWWHVGDVKVSHGAYIHAVSRSTDKLDLFLTDAKGRDPNCFVGTELYRWLAWLGARSTAAGQLPALR